MSERVPSSSSDASSDIDEARDELLQFFASQRAGVDVSHRRDDASIRKASEARDEATERAAFDWGAVLEAGLNAWWREHPLHAGAVLVKTATEEIARRKPMQLMAGAALAGAAIVLFKPWRLVSASALAVSIWRSSNFSSVTSDVLQSASDALQERKT